MICRQTLALTCPSKLAVVDVVALGEDGGVAVAKSKEIGGRQLTVFKALQERAGKIGLGGRDWEYALHCVWYLHCLGLQAVQPDLVHELLTCKKGGMHEANRDQHSQQSGLKRLSVECAAAQSCCGR